MKRLLVYFSYIGTNYRGLQRTKLVSTNPLGSGAPDLETVQGILDFGLQKVIDKRISLSISSRTDTKVHALESTGHFDVDEGYFKKISYSPEKICQSLNLFLDKNECDIRVKRVVEVPTDFYCRGASSRIYKFRVAVLNHHPHNISSNLRVSSTTEITELNRCEVVAPPFNIDVVQDACKLFLGKRDFTTFMKSSSEVIPPEKRVKTLLRFSVSPESISDSQIDSEFYSICQSPYDIYVFTVEGSGFLRRQVRRMVGALVAVGRGIVNEKDIKWMLDNPSEKNWNPKIGTMGPNVMDNTKEVPSDEAESCSNFASLLQNRLKRGLKPTTTKTTYPDGSVQYSTDQGTLASVSQKKNPGLSFGFVVDEKPDLTVGLVYPWLLLSSQDVPNEPQLLLRFNVSYILSLLPGFLLIEASQAIVKKHLVLDVFDEEVFTLDSHFCSQAFQFIEEAKHHGETVLVHCNAGISRAPSIVIAYLMQFENLSFDNAWEQVKAARPVIKPNFGFQKQLRSMDKS
ncbi:Dual specificity protein phosphatase 19 [Orchesella cincta]|uniref:Dual specificity protein phosphatase 19 n=1 Tax=Orchesella cincta TaxID=48709 RepID=A0A1D2MHJ9_ORCCI|nr:Dual specificity protein phosphatase 19 [Orchesella cincta]